MTVLLATKLTSKIKHALKTKHQVDVPNHSSFKVGNVFILAILATSQILSTEFVSLVQVTATVV